MSVWQWIIIADLALAGLVIFAWGFAGTTRTYDMWDAIGGVVECAFLIWIVAVQL